MNNNLMECVPNISNGSDHSVIEYCVDAIRQNSSLKLIDYSSDADHNRTVITFVGESDALVEGALELSKRAVQRIDLNTQKGTHPRMGAIDVIPFVPLGNTTIQDCIKTSEILAQKVAESLHLPVYLYALSARTENRKKLPTIRKGEFEGFAEKIKLPEWTPDFGPCERHPTAGVVAIGAREFLVAFNIYLHTPLESIAEQIAKNLRESSGGHRYLQAKGMYIAEKGLAQVSMNILDFNKLPLYRVIEMVRIEAKRFGVAVAESELIGLAPMQALLDTAAYYMQLPNLRPEHLVETKIWE
ncbi:MAG TPA: glutamate formimidoyltransferase [Caldisericia bacterium]|nr:glutamate formimidoyltransferase [Caldisericia bacterium]